MFRPILAQLYYFVHQDAEGNLMVMSRYFRYEDLDLKNLEEGNCFSCYDGAVESINKRGQKHERL